MNGSRHGIIIFFQRLQSEKSNLDIVFGWRERERRDFYKHFLVWLFFSRGGEANEGE